MGKKILKLTVGILVGALFLFFLLRHENWQQVAQAFKTVHLGWIALATLAFVLSMTARAERWYLILRPNSSKLTRALGYEVFFLGMGANAVLPFRIGDLLRGTVFCRYLSMPPIKTLTAVFLEKLFDLVIICSLGFAMFYFFPVAPTKMLKIGTDGLGLIVLILIAILIGAHYLRRPISFVLERIRRICPKLKSLMDVIEGQMHHVCDALALINDKLSFVGILFWSLVTWFLEAIAGYFVALGIPELTNPMASWAATPIAVLSTALPGAPGGIGTFDFFAERVMKLWGNPKGASTAYAFILHLIILVVPVLLAMISWGLNRDLIKSRQCSEK